MRESYLREKNQSRWIHEVRNKIYFYIQTLSLLNGKNNTNTVHGKRNLIQSIQFMWTVGILVLITSTAFAINSETIHDELQFILSETKLFPQVFAEEFVSEYTEDKVQWQTVYLSNDTGCKNAYYQRMNLYDELAENYMDEYGFNHKKKDKPQCMPVWHFIEKFDSPKDLELLIIILDRDLGRQELSRYGIGGLYYYDPASNDSISGMVRELREYRQHIIVICDCSSFKFSEPTWLLSHELSHFILNYLGYPKEITGDSVHRDDLQYDVCIEETSGNQYERECGDKTKAKVKANGQAYSVMRPYPDAQNMEFYNTEIDQKELDAQIEFIEKLLNGDIIDSYTYQEIKSKLTWNDEQKDRIMFNDSPKGKQDKSSYGTDAKDAIKNPVLKDMIDVHIDISFEDSVLLTFEDIESDLGVTNTYILDEKIRANSKVTFELSDSSGINCNEPIVESGGFYLQCDQKLENVVLTYNVSR